MVDLPGHALCKWGIHCGMTLEARAAYLGGDDFPGVHCTAASTGDTCAASLLLLQRKHLVPLRISPDALYLLCECVDFLHFFVLLDRYILFCYIRSCCHSLTGGSLLYKFICVSFLTPLTWKGVPKKTKIQCLNHGTEKMKKNYIVLSHSTCAK